MNHTARIVLGIGSGRCGTLALARLLDKQPRSHVTHERRPLLPWTSDEPERLASRSPV